MLDFLPSHPCLVKKMVSDIADMLAKVYLDKELCFFSDTHSQNVSIPSSVFGEKNLIISSLVAHLFSFRLILWSVPGFSDEDLVIKCCGSGCQRMY